MQPFLSQALRSSNLHCQQLLQTHVMETDSSLIQEGTFVCAAFGLMEDAAVPRGQYLLQVGCALPATIQVLALEPLMSVICTLACDKAYVFNLYFQMRVSGLPLSAWPVKRLSALPALARSPSLSSGICTQRTHRSMRHF